MKRLFQATLLLIATVSLTACGGSQEPVEITDTALVNEMNTTVIEGMRTYLDTTIPTDVAFEQKGYKNEGRTGNGDEVIHFNNVFQATAVEEPGEGQVVSYGGVLSLDGELTGLILNVKNDTLPVGAYTNEQLQEMASAFLRDKALVGADEALTFIGINNDASAKQLTIVKVNSTTHSFAIGLNLQTGTVFYFEHIPLPTVEAE